MFVVLGAIVLAFTGAEALYADLGHFGKRPIQLAWAGMVLPSLALNYMGQGALLMRDPTALANPFFRLFPSAWLIPAVVLATVATVIASQAVITGAYSMTKQAMQLGLLPRMHVLYTSAKEMGQIYMPLVNWTLLAAVLLAVVGFGSSSALASAYGFAVTVTMFTTTLLTFFVVRHAWKYPLPLAIGATSVFLALDLVLVIACSLKFMQGGWFPLVLGIWCSRSWQAGGVGVSCLFKASARETRSSFLSSRLSTPARSIAFRGRLFTRSRVPYRAAGPDAQPEAQPGPA